MMENQLKALEARMKNRERELTVAVDEGRNAARMERARMQAIHAQVYIRYVCRHMRM
jgi:hypothetical protein